MQRTYYQPLSSFENQPHEKAIKTYATSNLPFFSGEWLEQFKGFALDKNTWPSEKISSIIELLRRDSSTNGENNTLLENYERIYNRITS